MVVERGGKVVIKDVLQSFENGYSLDEIGIESGDQIIAYPRGTMDINTWLMILNLVTSVALLYIRLRFGTW